MLELTTNICKCVYPNIPEVDINIPGLPGCIEPMMQSVVSSLKPLTTVLEPVLTLKKLAEAGIAEVPSIVSDLKKEVNEVMNLVPPDLPNLVILPFKLHLPKDYHFDIDFNELIPSIKISIKGIELESLGKFFQGILAIPLELLFGMEGLVKKIINELTETLVAAASPPLAIIRAQLALKTIIELPKDIPQKILDSLGLEDPKIILDNIGLPKLSLGKIEFPKLPTIGVNLPDKIKMFGIDTYPKLPICCYKSIVELPLIPFTIL